MNPVFLMWPACHYRVVHLARLLSMGLESASPREYSSLARMSCETFVFSPQDRLLTKRERSSGFQATYCRSDCNEKKYINTLVRCSQKSSS